MAAFEELGLQPELIRAVEEDGWELPTNVQADAIPVILGGADVCVAAETGSGKTGAFGLPILQVVHETLRNKAIVKSVKVGSGPEEVRLDANDKDALMVHTPDLLECRTESLKNWMGIRGTSEVLRGKYQFEVVVSAPSVPGSDGLLRIGVSSKNATLNIGTDRLSFGYGGTGKKSFGGAFEDYGKPYSAGDVVGCLLDRSSKPGSVEFVLNGVRLGKAFGFPAEMGDTGVAPALCAKNCGGVFVVDELKFPIGGFQPLSKVTKADTAAGATEEFERAGRSERFPLCVILEPTRDLAMQTFSCMQQYAKFLTHPDIRMGLFVGGVEERKQKENLQQGVDICVGTYQKLTDFIRRGELPVSKLLFFVLDEADDLLKKDEKNDIIAMKNKACAGGRRVQTLFFSATLHSDEVKAAIDKITTHAIWVDLKGHPTIPDAVHAVVYDVNPSLDYPLPTTDGTVVPTDGIHEIAFDPEMHGEAGNSRRIKQYKFRLAVDIADALNMRNALIFCRTNLDCDNFERYLVARGGGAGSAFRGTAETGKESLYSCLVLAGMRDQSQRQQNLEHFKQGDVRFLVCTDVAARGLDIEGLPFLIMMTLPDEPEQFFHRIGRVGRADHMGLAISLVSMRKEKVWYHTCPSKGRGATPCRNTKLVDERGCCIWYDEPTLIKAIEEKVGSPLPRMDSRTLSVPGLLAAAGASVQIPDDAGRRERRRIVREVCGSPDEDPKLSRKARRKKNQKAAVAAASPEKEETPPRPAQRSTFRLRFTARAGPTLSPRPPPPTSRIWLLWSLTCGRGKEICR